MSEPPDDLLTALGLEQIERLKPFGAIAKAPVGTVLVEPGDREPDLIVVLDGEIEVFEVDVETGRETSVGVATPGMFMGELNVLSGETTFLRVRATVPSTVLRVNGDALRQLMTTDSDLGDLIFGVLVARRATGTRRRFCGRKQAERPRRRNSTLRFFCPRRRGARRWPSSGSSSE